MTDTAEIVKFYYDYKSPFTYLAFEPTLELERSHRVRIRFIPHQVDLRASYGGDLEQRDYRDWRKVRYLYMDARRFANERGIVIRGPQKLFDSTLSLAGGIFAERNGRFREYSRRVFERFFKRELDIENPAAMAALIEEIGINAGEFRRFAETDGPAALAAADAEAERDGIFGVPAIIAAGEMFWGNDRMEWAIKKLDALGLRRVAAGDATRAG
jgi:2-hydroxychromene-2-carboxylate isomerase